jgi:hypothetical protein
LVGALPHCRRALRQVASNQTNGQSPSIGRSRNAFTRTSMSLQNRETWLFERPDMPSP